MAKRPRAERRRMQQEDDSGDEFSDVDEELEASDVGDERPSWTAAVSEYAAALASSAARRKPVWTATTTTTTTMKTRRTRTMRPSRRRGADHKRARPSAGDLCPETAPFTTRAAADEFMRGKACQKAVKGSGAIKAARKGLREAELTRTRKRRPARRQGRAREGAGAQAKARKKAKPLSEAQIAARKEDAQKKRREERRAAAAGLGARVAAGRESGRAAATRRAVGAPSASRFARPACGGGARLPRRRGIRQAPP